MRVKVWTLPRPHKAVSSFLKLTSIILYGILRVLALLPSILLGTSWSNTLSNVSSRSILARALHNATSYLIRRIVHCAIVSERHTEKVAFHVLLAPAATPASTTASVCFFIFSFAAVVREFVGRERRIRGKVLRSGLPHKTLQRRPVKGPSSRRSVRVLWREWGLHPPPTPTPCLLSYAHMHKYN